MFALVQDNVVVEVRHRLPREWAGIPHFAYLGPFHASKYGWFMVVRVIPSYDPRIEKLSEPTYVPLEGRVEAVYTPVMIDLQAIKDAKIEEIDMKAIEIRVSVIGKVHPSEMASWQEKYRQAKAYQAAVQAGTPNPAQECPDLVSEAQYRQVSLVNLVTKVIQKGNALKAFEAQLAGVSGRHADAVRAIDPLAYPTPRDAALAVANYDFSTGWPLV